MAGIVDSLVAHLESQILSGNSHGRVSAEVLQEFMSDVSAPAQTAAPKPAPIQQTQAPVQQSTVPVTPEVKVPVTPEIKAPEAIVETKPAPAFVPPVEEAPKPQEIEISKDVSGMSLAELRMHGNSCSACEFKLGEKRSKETGLNESARLMIISEPSGRTEEHMLDPFHDNAGELLLKMISAMKIDLDELYICMAHKCFGPGAREKIVETKPFLEKQIELVKPEVVLIFGGAALNILLGEQSLMKNRGKWLDINGVPAMATYPPAYLQQKGEAKKEAWSDMQQVMARLN